MGGAGVDEARDARNRAADDEAALARVGSRVVDCMAGVFCLTATAGTYPTRAPGYFLLQPAEVGGDEVEGGVATATATVDPPFLAFFAGTTAPDIGTPVVALADGLGRWIF